jgi:hypothetical protein
MTQERYDPDNEPETLHSLPKGVKNSPPLGSSSWVIAHSSPIFCLPVLS